MFMVNQVKYPNVVSLYLLCVGLTGNLFNLTSPLLALQGGGGAGIPNVTEITIASSKTRSYLPALELSFNDELTLFPVDHWTGFITFETELSNLKPISRTKMSPFLI